MPSPSEYLNLAIAEYQKIHGQRWRLSLVRPSNVTFRGEREPEHLTVLWEIDYDGSPMTFEQASVRYAQNIAASDANGKYSKNQTLGGNNPYLRFEEVFPTLEQLKASV